MIVIRRTRVQGSTVSARVPRCIFLLTPVVRPVGGGLRLCDMPCAQSVAKNLEFCRPAFVSSPANVAAIRRDARALYLREMPAIAIRAMAVRRARDAERAPRRPRSPFTRTRAARRPNEGMACPATGAEMAPSASEDNAEGVSESCTICMSSPRAVRFLPCRHAVMCEVCAMTEMKRTGNCSHCRRTVEGLVFVPMTPLRPKRLKTHQDEPEPEGFYQSVQEFLQQATLHRTASEAPGPPARPRSPLSAGHPTVLTRGPRGTCHGAPRACRPRLPFSEGCRAACRGATAFAARARCRHCCCCRSRRRRAWRSFPTGGQPLATTTWSRAAGF